MNKYRTLAYHSQKAEQKLSDMAGKKIIRPVNRTPRTGHDNWHEIEHLGMGIPDTPENKRHIDQAKKYADRFHKHVDFILSKPLPDDLTHDELSEIQDNLQDVQYELDQEAETMYNEKDYDGLGFPVFLFPKDVNDRDNDFTDSDRADYVQIFDSGDHDIWTRKQNIGKNKAVDRMIAIGKRYQNIESILEQITAKMEWIEKGERE